MNASRQNSFRSMSIWLLSAMVIPSGVIAEYRDELTSECEIAVARSALPLRLRDSASVYVLQDGAYEKVVQGEGPMTCVVERNHRDSIAPQCMDSAGIDSILPAIISRSLMSANGATYEAIEEDNAKRISNGEYQPAERAGVSYMMSDYTYTYIESSERVMKIPPHIMIYAPHLTNAEIGGSFKSMSENIGTPFVFREGLHGFIIAYTQYRADPNEVAEKCRGQLGEPPPSFDPFPKG